MTDVLSARPAGLLNRRSRTGSRGLSVIEFVVAAALILGIMVASGITLANIERSLATSRARDGATLLVSNLLNQAVQFRCQLTVNPSDAAGEASRCIPRLTGSALTSTTTGDMMFTSTFPSGCVAGTDPGCVKYTALLTSRWLDATKDPSVCQDPRKQPSLLRRTLELRWRPSGATEDVVSRTSTFQAVPQSGAYDTTSTKVLVVRTDAPGKVVSYSTPQGTITRVAEACSENGSLVGEAFFPYRPTQSSDHRVAVSGAAIAAADWTNGVLPTPSQSQILDTSDACLLWRPSAGGKPGGCP